MKELIEIYGDAITYIVGLISVIAMMSACFSKYQSVVVDTFTACFGTV